MRLVVLPAWAGFSVRTPWIGFSLRPFPWHPFYQQNLVASTLSLDHSRDSSRFIYSLMQSNISAFDCFHTTSRTVNQTSKILNQTWGNYLGIPLYFLAFSSSFLFTRQCAITQQYRIYSHCCQVKNSHILSVYKTKPKEKVIFSTSL